VIAPAKGLIIVENWNGHDSCGYSLAPFAFGGAVSVRYISNGFRLYVRADCTGDYVDASYEGCCAIDGAVTCTYLADTLRLAHVHTMYHEYLGFTDSSVATVPECSGNFIVYNKSHQDVVGLSAQLAVSYNGVQTTINVTFNQSTYYYDFNFYLTDGTTTAYYAGSEPPNSWGFAHLVSFKDFKASNDAVYISCSELECFAWAGTPAYDFLASGFPGVGLYIQDPVTYEPCVSCSSAVVYTIPTAIASVLVGVAAGKVLFM